MLRADRITCGPLTEISFDVVRGEAVALVGTPAETAMLLRAIAGLVPVRAGSLIVEGIDAAAHPTQARRRTWWSGALLRHGSVGDYLTLIAAARRSPRASALRQLAERHRLRWDAPLTGLGSDEQTALSLCAARAAATPILLIDAQSVTTSEARASWQVLMDERTAAGETTLIGCEVPQQLTCTRTFVLDRGRMVAATEGAFTSSGL